MVRMITLVLCLVLMLFGTGAATASTAKTAGDAEADAYSAELKSEHVPGWSEDFEYAWGQATLIQERATGDIFLTVNFYGLESEVISTVLMRASDEQVLHDLPTASHFSETISGPNTELAAALASHDLVIQVNDERYPTGAIRGTFLFVIVDIDARTWSEVRTLFN